MEVVHTETGEEYFLAESTEDITTYLLAAPQHSVLAMDTETTGAGPLTGQDSGPFPEPYSQDSDLCPCSAQIRDELFPDRSDKAGSQLHGAP